MRPVLLEMDGFASFRDPATVDFTDADFFALVGPTGSGKSTVIDAMTFALYGTVPRWQHKSMVMYALAPTANRGTVRLVFDVQPHRYVVARELRRAKAGGVTIRSGRLERLLDPAATGTINDPTEVLAADGAVTAAVEKLLGLSFEHFCQCVVLPQGEFAEFLRAKGSDRRAILLKLLGAGLYGDIGQAANKRGSLAERRAALLAGELGGLADATEAAESIAAEREHAMTTLAATVDAAVPRWRAAALTLKAARDRQDVLAAEHAALTAVRLPDGVAALDASAAAARVAAATAQRAERSAQQADTAARELLAAAPDRGPLEQARRDHAERTRLLAEIPAATEAVASATARLEQAAQSAGAATAAVDARRRDRDSAAVQAQVTAAEVTRLTTEFDVLSAVTLPGGLGALDDRAQAADQALRAAAGELDAAELRDSAARAAVSTAPRRAPLETTLGRIRELAEATAALAPLNQEQQRAVAEHDAARQSLAAAGALIEGARAAREELVVAGGAAVLRPHLAVGDACPVCEQTVLTLPPPAHVPKLVAADQALAAAQTRLQRAGAAESAAATALAAVSAELGAAEGRVTRLRALLAGQPTQESVILDALAGLDALEAAEAAAGRALQAAREKHRTASSAVNRLDGESTALRVALRAARDPLVALGAPSIDDRRLLDAWTRLSLWAARQATTVRRALSTARAADDVARAALALAETSFAAAEADAATGRAAETALTRTLFEANAVLSGLHRRLAELTTALDGAPTAGAVLAQLNRLDELAGAAREADAAVQRARAQLAEAEVLVRELDREISTEWQSLRAARDRLVAFGAPDLAGDSVLAAWTALLDWSTGTADARATALADAAAAVDTATRQRDDLAAALTAEFALLDITLPAGEVAEAAPVAAATALAQASAEQRRIAERRERLARLTAQHAAAETDQHVAKMLGNLLRSNMFPEWLEAAALDTLVADASVRLAELSNGQFELTHRSGEFFVIDHADADSQRGVRTLSGGETFQASLALALALSTQLSSIAAAGAARLDSIFLDEGFGTLDESTLEIVAGTLESLAQSDRMVGVVTHVAGLAERIPVRFVVNRDSRTSSISRGIA